MTPRDVLLTALGTGSGLPTWPLYLCATILTASIATLAWLRGRARYEAAVRAAAEMGDPT